MVAQEEVTQKRDRRAKPCCFLLIFLLVVFLVGMVRFGPFLDRRVVTVAVQNSSGDERENQKVRHWSWQSRQRLPSCFIIGVRKGGTRALLRLMDLHPKIRAYRGRELHFFDNDQRYSRGIRWYRRKMPFSWPDQITVEKTPAYFHIWNVPQRMKLLNPDARILLVVRDPVVRLISDYVQLREKALFRGSDYMSFEKSVFLRNGSVNAAYTPVKFGFYHKYFQNWLRSFERRQIHVVDGEKLIKNPLKQLRTVESFLKIGHEIKTRQIVFDSDKGFFCPVEKGRVKCLGKSKGRNHPKVSDTRIRKLKSFYAAENKKFCGAIAANFTWCSYLSF